MSVVIRYNPSGLTRAQYDKVNEFFMQQMQENPDAAAPPDALQVHVLFGEEGSLQVSEIWASEEAWRENYEGMLGQALDHGGVERDPQVMPAQELWGSGVPGPPAPPA
jgi:hypothetical protein